MTSSSSIEILKQYKDILDESAIVSKTDPKGIITYVNDKFCQISGYSKNELLGKPHNIIRHPDNPKEIYREMWHQLKNKKIWRGIVKNRAKDGRDYYVKSIISPILDNNGNIIEYIAARVDITEIIKQEEIIKKQYKDNLTGLQNRSALMCELNDQCIEKGKKATLILIDIENFSNINEYYGYDIGDKILKLMAKELSKTFEKVYRISGDEFAILCEHKLDKETRAVLYKLISELESKTYLDDEYRINLTLSCGVAHDDRNVIYKQAHIALKENKSSNTQLTIFSDIKDIEKIIEQNIKTTQMLRDAIFNNSVVAYLQGIYDNQANTINKYEILMRIKDQNGKVIPPNRFLEQSKKSKIYTKLTKAIIKKAFDIFGNSSYDFSINLSMQDIESKKIRKILFENIKKYNIGKRLIVEIVESESIQNYQQVIDFIKRLKSFGCQVAIDDFGSGYSNFEYIVKMDIDYIKLDGSLIKDIDKDKNKFIIVESILNFANKLGIKTVAEFVENEMIYMIVKKLGINYSQGYYFSKPSPSISI